MWLGLYTRRSDDSLDLRYRVRGIAVLPKNSGLGVFLADRRVSSDLLQYKDLCRTSCLSGPRIPSKSVMCSAGTADKALNHYRSGSIHTLQSLIMLAPHFEAPPVPGLLRVYSVSIIRPYCTTHAFNAT